VASVNRLQAYWISALILLCIGCVSSGDTPSTESNWEIADIPVCAPDMEGKTVRSALTSTARAKFKGRVVTLGDSGESVPVQDVQFFSYIIGFWTPWAPEKWDPRVSYLAPLDITTDENGYFFDESSMASCVTLTVCKDGQPSEQELPVAAVYLLRSPGCEDERVVFSTDWIEHEIVLTRTE